jgi:hypothetical protein
LRLTHCHGASGVRIPWISSLVLLAMIASAQTLGQHFLLNTVNGALTEELLGVSVRSIGDVNHDGVTDFIVGAATGFPNVIADAPGGLVRVYSGKDGTLLYTLRGASAGDSFGWSVSGIGDVNKDGCDDFIVGAPFGTQGAPSSGYAKVFSGCDGSVLPYNDLAGDTAEAQFGWSVSGAGDVNGDGFPDFIVGAPGDSTNGTESGTVKVFSGRDGSVLYVLRGSAAGAFFGGSVSSVGDVNQDEFPDFIVGANGADSATVFSGKNGSILYTLHGTSPGIYFGDSVSGAGDVNGDGFPDIIVGAPRDNKNGAESGSATVFSGRDGSILYTLYGRSAGNRFGWSVASAGDFNHDGHADVIVGAPFDDFRGTDSGSIRVFSGVDGSPLVTAYGHSPGEWFGVSVFGVGDINGDGFSDFLVGSTGVSVSGKTCAGAALLFSGGPVLCDLDGNGIIDVRDIQMILAARGTEVTPNAPGDVDGDGVITVNDARVCTLQCANRLCAVTSGRTGNPGLTGLHHLWSASIRSVRHWFSRAFKGLAAR